MFYPSCIELSKLALQKNLRFLRDFIGRDVVFSSVIKGNAYGHGINVFVPLAEACGVRHFSVFSADEALRALKSRTKPSDIMIMGAIDNPEVEWAVENRISFYIFELERLRAALQAAQGLGIPARIHLELETGMNRTGLQDGQVHEAVKLIKDNHEHFVIDGVCTHYAGAESVGNHLRVQTQIQSYNDQCAMLKEEGLDLGRRHTACSAAALSYPETIMDMVRIGIAHYGYWPSRETRMHYILNRPNGKTKRHIDPLHRVLRWSSRIMSIKRVKAGEFVSYGTSYQTTRDETIASVPVGYFHGFARGLSNLGYVLVHGRRCPVVGIVNMHMITVNVTGLTDVKKGDEVVIIGKQRKQQITVGSFSDLSRFLNYEILVRLPSEVPRVVVD
jgi:alanine racemase